MSTFCAWQPIALWEQPKGMTKLTATTSTPKPRTISVAKILSNPPETSDIAFIMIEWMTTDFVGDFLKGKIVSKRSDCRRRAENPAAPKGAKMYCLSRYQNLNFRASCAFLAGFSALRSTTSALKRSLKQFFQRTTPTKVDGLG